MFLNAGGRLRHTISDQISGRAVFNRDVVTARYSSGGRDILAGVYSEEIFRPAGQMERVFSCAGSLFGGTRLVAKPDSCRSSLYGRRILGINVHEI